MASQFVNRRSSTYHCILNNYIAGMSMTLDVLSSLRKSSRYKCILFSMHNLIRTCFPFPIHVPNRNGEYMFPQSTFTFKHNVTSSCLMKHIEGTHKNFWENFLVSLEVLCQTVYRDIIILLQRYYFCCKYSAFKIYISLFINLWKYCRPNTLLKS